jgi:hypothetical protein
MREIRPQIEHFASAEHRIFAKQKAERSAYIQLGDVANGLARMPNRKFVIF